MISIALDPYAPLHSLTSGKGVPASKEIQCSTRRWLQTGAPMRGSGTPAAMMLRASVGKCVMPSTRSATSAARAAPQNVRASRAVALQNLIQGPQLLQLGEVGKPGVVPKRGVMPGQAGNVWECGQVGHSTAGCVHRSPLSGGSSMRRACTPHSKCPLEPEAR